MSSPVRITTDLPAARIEQAIAANEMLVLAFPPAALADLLAGSNRPRMERVGSLPEPTAEEVRSFFVAHDLRKELLDTIGEPVRERVLLAARLTNREPVDVISEMTGLARLPKDAGDLPLATEELFNPRLMLVSFMKVESRSPFRAGDRVRHRPSGETWILAVDEREDGSVYPCGWPESRADAADCELVEAASDEKRLEMLRHVAGGHDDEGTMSIRRSVGRHQLARAEAAEEAGRHE